MNTFFHVFYESKMKIRVQSSQVRKVTLQERHKNEINKQWVPTQLFSAFHVMVFGPASQCRTNT
jgi:hypothetical protein